MLEQYMMHWQPRGRLGEQENDNCLQEIAKYRFQAESGAQKVNTVGMKTKKKFSKPNSFNFLAVFVVATMNWKANEPHYAKVVNLATFCGPKKR